MEHKFKITASGSSPQFSIRTLENRRMVYPFHSVKTRRPFSRKQKASGHNGQTAFYRHENAMTQMINWAAQSPKDSVRMLVVPSSIGCEPYTFAMMAENHSQISSSKLVIDTFDVSDQFLKYAKAGIYPTESLIGLAPDLTQHFTISADGKTGEVRPNIKQRVNFLPHCSLKKFKPSSPYDIVVSQNMLKHIFGAPWDEPEDVKKLGYRHKQAEAIKNLCDLTAEAGLLFVDMVEETPFALHYENAPFNPFEDNGMIFLDKGLIPFENGTRFPNTEREVVVCIKNRDFVYALQKQSPFDHPDIS
jgi:hypothetical protein